MPAPSWLQAPELAGQIERALQYRIRVQQGFERLVTVLQAGHSYGPPRKIKIESRPAIEAEDAAAGLA